MYFCALSFKFTMKELYLRIFELSQRLIVNPKEFWKQHTEIRENRDDLFRNSLLPLMAVVALAVFLGEFFRSDYFRIWVALLWVLREIVLFATLFFFGVYGTEKIIKYSGYPVNIENLQKLVAYSMVPFFIVSAVTGFLPFLKLLDIFGIYGFYIFMLGGRKLIAVPRENREPLFLKIIAANWIVFGVISFFLAKLLTTLD